MTAPLSLPIAIGERIKADAAACGVYVVIPTGNPGQLVLRENADRRIVVGTVSYNFELGAYSLRLTIRGRDVLTPDGKRDFYQGNSDRTDFWETFSRELKARATKQTA